MPEPYRILFVCWGNICRSPSAECVFNHHLQAEGLDTAVTCDSAGTISDHEGNPPDSRMRQTGASRGIAIEGAARKITPADFENFDLILAMDDFNLSSIKSIAPGGTSRATIALYCDYCGIDHTDEVPDPYYGGQDGFDKVLNLLEEGTTNLITRLQKEER